MEATQFSNPLSSPSEASPAMSAQPKPYLSPAEYLAIERAADRKSEYYRGEMFLMSGASREHNLVGFNLNRLVGNGIVKSDCEAYAADMRVKIDATGLYTYPDLVLTCEEPEFEDAELDTLVNPQALFEVLRDSTEAYDRGKKFEHYRSIATLREYFLIAQDRPHIERFSLGADGVWGLTDATGMEAKLRIDSIDLELSLGEVYAKVKFDPEGAPVEG